MECRSKTDGKTFGVWPANDVIVPGTRQIVNPYAHRNRYIMKSGNLFTGRATIIILHNNNIVFNNGWRKGRLIIINVMLTAAGGPGDDKPRGFCAGANFYTAKDQGYPGINVGEIKITAKTHKMI